MLFFFNDPATTEIYTLSLHDALPISGAIALVSNGGYAGSSRRQLVVPAAAYEGEHAFLRGLQLGWHAWQRRSEEHTSELQSRRDLVCRLLLEKKKIEHNS